MEKRGQIFRIDKLESLFYQSAMARPLRVEISDGYYHVMNRGEKRLRQNLQVNFIS